MSTWSGDSSSFSPSEFPNFAARERDSDDSVTSNSSSNSSSNDGRNDRSNEVRAGYSVANSSENPSDRQSLADIEEVVNQSRRKREREEVARRVEQNVENELDREIKSDSQSPQTGHGPLRLHKRRPNKKQRTCSGLIIFGFFLAVFAVIGVGAVVYYVVLDNSFLSSEYSEKVEAPSPGNGFATPTWPPASTPVPTQDPTGPPTFPTRSPIAQYLAQEHGVVFPDDPIAPGYQAITWLVDEANTPGAKIIYDLRLVQRFAMVAVNLALKTDESGLSFGEIGVDECDWEGVFCVNGTVTELSFGQKLLTGIIPPEIGLLQSLVSLDLSDNALFGRIPETLYDLINLERLFLYKNKLVGTISDRIGNLKHLSHLHLSHNTFTGSLPKSMFDQKNSPFYYINVYSNSFSGSLPSMSGWQNIWYLDLGRNDFSGPLPWDMHKMTALQHLHLDHNSFSGTIEIDFEKVGGGELQALSLDNNQFTGYFPYERGTLFSLASATLTNNSFSEIDWHICELSSLEEFADGALVEYTADCNICWCQPWCGHC